jgi:preprotein translocase subunit SecG
MTLLINVLLGLYVFVAVLMMLVILMQRPKSEGLGAAFGGGVTENIFGAQTTNVLTKFTGWLAATFFLLTFVLSILYARKANTQSNLTSRVTAGTTPVPVASATPVPGASVSASPAASGSAKVSPASSSSVVPSATVTSSSPATTSPAPSAAMSPAPATTPAPSPKSSAAPSVSASPKP